MNILSLFDGISCARVACVRSGINIENYFASEIDKYAIKVAKINFPDTVHLGDIKKMDGSIFANIELLIGGSPCQDLSIAKKNRKGLDGEKSGLFREYVRILHEVKPERFILENVASMPKDAKETITRELGVEPIMINASLVSAQSRKRLFRTNIPGVTQPDDRGILLKDILQDDVSNDFFLSEKTIESVKSRNNAQAGRIRGIDGKSVTLQAGGGGTGAKTGLYRLGNINPSGRGIGGNVYSADGKSPNITTNKGEGMKVFDGKIRKLTPIECERLQGLSDNYTEGVSNSQRYKMLGNAFNVDVVAHILSFIPIE